MSHDLQIFEISGRHFVPGGHMPCLDTNGLLPRILAEVIGSAPKHGPQRLVLFGHAGDEIFPEFNFDLSHRRGLAVRALILQDSLAWKLASFGASTAELSLTLAGVAAAMGWDCDTNKRGHLVEGESSDALRVFQTACLHRYRSPQQENGMASVLCWHGVYCVLTELILKTLMRIYPAIYAKEFGSWPILQLGYEDGLGVFPCGASFLPRPQKVSCSSRRVDLVFLSKAIHLQAKTNRRDLLSIDDVPIYDQKRFRHLVFAAGR